MFEHLAQRPSLGSDNHSGVHPEIMEAVVAANLGHMPAYGSDPITAAAQAVVRQHFGDVDVHFVFNGTAANVLALRTMLPSHASVLCAATAHLNVDECAAPEYMIGCKIYPLPSHAGKVMVDDVRAAAIRRGDQHYAGARVLSLSQPTELGTVYSIEELRALCATAHDLDMLVHMDGSRLVNAAVHLDVGLAALTADVGVDVLSLGGTKNGLMLGEAVVFFNRSLAKSFAYVRKQSLQLCSKMRFVAAQFHAFLSGDLWQRNARHANAMAQRLLSGVRSIMQVDVPYPVQSNAVFVRLPRPWLKPLRDQYFFYVWDERTFEVRWMTSFDTQGADIDRFVASLQDLRAGT